MVFNNKNNNINENFANNVEVVSEKSEDNRSDITTTNYYIIQKCISKYLGIINKNNPAYYRVNDNGENVKFVNEDYIKGRIYDLLSENYINKNNQPFTHLKIIDKVKEENIACAEALEQFYEDKEFIYYFPCIKSKNVIVIYSNGYQETVATSLEYGDITIEDLERNNIEFIKHKKDM